MGSQHQELFRMATTTATYTWKALLITLGLLLSIAMSMADWQAEAQHDRHTVYCQADVDTKDETKLGDKYNKVIWNSHRVGTYYPNGEPRTCQLDLTGVPSNKYIIISIKRFGVGSDIDCNEDYVQFEVYFQSYTFKSKRLCGRLDEPIMFKHGPYRNVPEPGPKGHVIANFIRGGVGTGKKGTIGFKIKMFWVGEADLDSNAIDLPE